MKQKLLLILAAATIVAGCSKNETGYAPEKNSTTPIALVGRSLSVETKAPFEGGISTANKLTALIPASLTEDDYTTQYALGTMTFGDESNATGYNTEGFAGNKNYPADETTPVYLAGLYPATGWGSYNTTATFTFTGKEDVMAAPQVATTKIDVTVSPAAYKNLAFTHLLTKLDIKIVAEDAAAATEWGTIKSITLTKSQNSTTFMNAATVTLKTGATTFAGSTSPWAVYDGETAITDKVITLPTDAATKVGYTLVAPITATADADADFTMAIIATRDGVDYTKEDIAVNLKNKESADFSGSTAGKSFTVTLTFRAKAQGIKATASVTPWEDGGSANTDVD